MPTYAYTFTSGDTVTPTKLNNARTISDIVNADIKSDAAIAGTKIAPDFGSQDVKTTGNALVGIGSARTNIDSSGTPKLQVEGTDFNTSSMTIIRNSASAQGGQIVLGKTRSATALGNTVAQSGDMLGSVIYAGADGTNLLIGAQILAAVDGTPGTNDMPGRLVFSTTADGGSSPTERMRITSDGLIIAANTSSNTTVTGSFVTSGRIQSEGSYNTTTASAANVFVSSAGLFFRSTSSARYKTNIETAQKEYSEAAVYTSRPVWFRSTCEDDRQDWSHWGFIAEEVAEIDPRLAQWGPDENGTLRPEGVQYDRFVPHLCAVVKSQRGRIDALEARIAALEAAQ